MSTKRIPSVTASDARPQNALQSDFDNISDDASTIDADERYLVRR